MPETVLLSAWILIFVSNSSLKGLFFGKLNVFRNFFASLKFKTPVFWEYHILPGHRLLSLLAERSSFSLVSSYTFFCSCTSFIYQRSRLMISAWLMYLRQYFGEETARARRFHQEVYDSERRARKPTQDGCRGGSVAPPQILGESDRGVLREMHIISSAPPSSAPQG